ncbi:1,4-alpha-glucan branching protein GlgB [Sulfurivermis fontis]|uniref:1,4-alpha-glucan branching protein GlgB n=1 Tax=Sulfurivermis fontis TaxID=1972068 RepID=UPI000FD8C6BC|nr:1,4-alpha-glucan branching protein GlgB [Sulfurivermis fontis]
MSELPDAHRRILEARHHDPFTVLGRHQEGDSMVIRALLPGTAEAAVEGNDGLLPMTRLYNSDLFEWRGDGNRVPLRYRLHWRDGSGHAQALHDPYCFPPQLGDFDLYLFGEGRHHHAYRFLGAHPRCIDGIDGVQFAVWAPNAERVSVVGDFNRWDGRCHPMRTRGGGGVWELFIPGLQAGTLYKFELRHRDSGAVMVKTDPYGRRFELRPATAAIVDAESRYPWQDGDWLRNRANRDWLHTPMTIYEVHLGSWQKDDNYHFLSYRELAQRLVDYVKPMGFTHIELLPVTEHPLDGSWGYQSTGYYAATSRFGHPDDLRYLVDLCHQNGIGVILDWVPAHFPRDAFALARFDGSPLYEHEDPRRGEHRDWGTLIFNYGRNEVKNFLISSAVYWLQEFHIDALRVDAVASMLYLDYSRQPGDWLPNVYGGRENLEAIAFLQELNSVVHEQFPGALTMAEESTAWPMVSRPVSMGGLGFSMKWNMGWMNDTLNYMHKEPVHRAYHHDLLTFGLLYAFSENFILPFSHDEVVHGKRSMLDKMPGDDWQRFANLRLLYTYMYTMPGKKLLFMGNEFGQGREWDDDHALDWYLLERPQHQGVHRLVGDLNRLYREQRALHYYDFEGQGFEWIDCHDARASLLSYVRRAGEELVVVALNFTPVPHHHFRLGVPRPGSYEVVFNSDSGYYGGSNIGSAGPLSSEAIPHMGRQWSVQFPLPPLAGVVLRLKP